MNSYWTHTVIKQWYRRNFRAICWMKCQNKLLRNCNPLFRSTFSWHCARWRILFTWPLHYFVHWRWHGVETQSETVACSSTKHSLLFTMTQKSKNLYGIDRVTVENRSGSSPQWWSGRSTTLHDVLNLWSRDLQPLSLWYAGIGNGRIR